MIDLLGLTQQRHSVVGDEDPLLEEYSVAAQVRENGGWAKIK